MLWGVAIAAWHVPAAYDFALSHEAVHDLEHASFVSRGRSSGRSSSTRPGAAS